MSVNESKKKANAKWDKQNMTTVGCKVTKEKAAQFKAACEKLGIVPNQVFLQAINTVIEKAEG